jgi:Zn-dependent peptidase ImmA (M78 family)
MSIQSARNYAEMLIEHLGINDAPVDLDVVARHFNLQIIFISLDDDVSGLLITKPDRSCIAVREQDHKARQRFTMAHEIGHYCLRHQFEPGQHVHVDRGYAISQRNTRSSTGTDQKEIEANQFAARLLMPTKLLQKSIRELNADHLYDIHVTKLAIKFGVSEQAMTIRLSGMGFL